MLYAIVFSWLSSLALATVTVGKVDCPQQFEGRVEEILEDVASSTVYSKQQLVLKNLKTIQGEVEEQVTLSVLKNGPVTFERGEDYRIQVRDGRLCWVEKI